MSSPADEILADRLVKSSRMTAGNRSTINSDSTDTSSNHSVASEATSAMDLATFDERPPSLLSPDDVEATVLTPQSNSSSPEILSLAGGEKHGSSVLRVPTPSSWERFKFSRGNGVPPATDVEMKDSDTPSLPNMQKKLCECKNSKTVGMHCGNCKLSVDSHKLLDNQKVTRFYLCGFMKMMTCEYGIVNSAYQ
jgi:hypothetical protein